MKDKVISIQTAGLLMIITFLLGGFFGDWKASYELKQTVMSIGIVANQAKNDISVVSNSIKNIEKNIDKIEAKMQ